MAMLNNQRVTTNTYGEIYWNIYRIYVCIYVDTSQNLHARKVELQPKKFRTMFSNMAICAKVPGP